MEKELGEFEGRTVQASIGRFTGRNSRRVGKYAQDEFAYVIAKVRVDKVSHQDFTAHSGKDQARLYSRIHDMKVVNSVVLPEDIGEKFLTEGLTAASDLFGYGDDTLFAEREREDHEAEADDRWEQALEEANIQDAEVVEDDPEQ